MLFRSQGWRNNVMDHHLTRYMFKLKSRQAGEAVVEKEETAVEKEETAVEEEAPDTDMAVEEEEQ